METMLEIRHCTSRAIAPLIKQDGLRAQEWVTMDSVEHLTRDERYKGLELNNNSKGECYCKGKIAHTDVIIPEQGSFTSGGLSQRRTLKVVKMECECESTTPWGTIILTSLLILGGIWLNRQIQNQRQAESMA